MGVDNIEKQILHYKEYTIDEYGNVYSYKNNNKKKLKPWLDSKNNYLMISLSENNIVKKYLIHRLVAIAFIPNPENKSDVDHIDHNMKNNHVTNLRWVSHQENLHHSYEIKDQVRNYVVVQLFYNEEYIGTFKSISLACRYANKKYGISYSSLQKYERSGNARIERIGVTTIENIKIINSLDEVE